MIQGENATKAGRLLNLYARPWQGNALQDNEFVISADVRVSRSYKLPSMQIETYFSLILTSLLNASPLRRLTGRKYVSVLLK